MNLILITSNIFTQISVFVWMEYTSSYTPKQNGVAERLNRTILEKVRAVIVDSSFPKYLWGDAVCCVIYQLNTAPTRALNGKVSANVYNEKSHITFRQIKSF